MEKVTNFTFVEELLAYLAYVEYYKVLGHQPREVDDLTCMCVTFLCISFNIPAGMLKEILKKKKRTVSILWY